MAPYPSFNLTTTLNKFDSSKMNIETAMKNVKKEDLVDPIQLMFQTPVEKKSQRFRKLFQTFNQRNKSENKPVRADATKFSS